MTKKIRHITVSIQDIRVSHHTNEGLKSEK